MGQSLSHKSISEIFRRLSSVPAVLSLLCISCAGLAANSPPDGPPDSGARKGLSLIQAIQWTLEKQPGIFIEQQSVLSSEGAMDVARAPFDWQITSSLSYDDEVTPLTRTERDEYGAKRLETGTIAQEVGFEKLFPSGIQVNPHLEMSATDDKTMGEPTRDDLQMACLVIVPLMKGSGTVSGAADLKAAGIDVEISRFSLRHVVATSIRDTALAYWDYAAAQKEMEILSEAEDRARGLVDVVQKLVNASQRPASDLGQVQANLDDKVASRIRAGVSLLVAKNYLGLSIGLPHQEIASMALPSDEFLSLEKGSLPLAACDPLLESASRLRPDLEAARKTVTIADIQLEAALLDRRHELNLVLEADLAGLSEDQGSMKIAPPGYSGGIEYRYAFMNRAAIGLATQYRAAREQAVIQREDLERQILSNVALAFQTLQQGLDELSSQRAAVASYGKAVEDEGKKLRMGMSTVLDLIDVEDRLRNARLGEVSACQNVSVALIQLKYASGLLLSDKGEAMIVGPEELTRIPGIGE